LAGFTVTIDGFGSPRASSIPSINGPFSSERCSPRIFACDVLLPTRGKKQGFRVSHTEQGLSKDGMGLSSLGFLFSPIRFG
jgi:hypothetical protein